MLRKPTALPVLVALLVLSGGCLAPSNATRTLWAWNQERGSTWENRALFVVFLPVYTAFVLSDVLLFNPFAHWADEPLVDPPVAADGEKVEG